MNSAQMIGRIPGLTYRQLDSWCTKGYLRPDIQSPGSGYARDFDHTEFAVAERMARLVAAGVLPAAAAVIARGRSELAPGITVRVERPSLVATGTGWPEVAR